MNSLNTFKYRGLPVLLALLIISQLIKAQSASNFTWTLISQCLNPRGSENSNSRPLQYHPKLGLITFIQTQSPTYSALPAPNTASHVMVAYVSADFGTTWDSTCVWSNNLWPAINPQLTVLNPAGNTLLANAKLVATGATANSGTISGSWIATKSLGSGSYNNIAPSSPGLISIVTNSPPYSSLGKTDLLQYDLCYDNTGTVRSLGVIANNMNQNPPLIRGSRIVKGSVNSGTFTWTSDSVIPNFALHSVTAIPLVEPTPHMAWNEAGTVGYVWFIGKHPGSTGTNSGYQPIVYKTINGGASWQAYPSINFVPFLNNHPPNLGLQPVPNSTVVVPVFNSKEGIDGVVDMNNNLHIVSTLKSGGSLHPDSAGKTQTFNHADGETYSYPYTPTYKPYIFDFTTNSSGGWAVRVIDALKTEAPGQTPQTPGYPYNPWSPNASGYRFGSGARLQLSRSEDGRLILFTWADSDTFVTASGFKWNNIPYIYCRLMDVCSQNVSTNNVILNADFIPVNQSAYLFHLSPKLKTITAISYSGNYEIEFAISAVNYGPLFTDSISECWIGRGRAKFKTLTMDPPGPFVDCMVVSNEEFVESNIIKIYPNPINDVFIIENSNAYKIKLIIRDITGKMMAEFDVNERVQLNTRNLNKGFYLVEAWHNGKLLLTKKLIKQ